METNSCRSSSAKMWISGTIASPDHPLRDTLVGLQGSVLHEYRGPSLDCPYDVGRFPGEMFQNRIPPSFAGFVDPEVQALIDRGCVVKWSDVRGPAPPPRLR